MPNAMVLARDPISDTHPTDSDCRYTLEQIIMGALALLALGENPLRARRVLERPTACRSDLMPKEPLETVPLSFKGEPTGKLAYLPCVGGLAEESARWPPDEGDAEDCTCLPSDVGAAGDYNRLHRTHAHRSPLCPRRRWSTCFSPL